MDEEHERTKELQRLLHDLDDEDDEYHLDVERHEFDQYSSPFVHNMNAGRSPEYGPMDDEEPHVPVQLNEEDLGELSADDISHEHHEAGRDLSYGAQSRARNPGGPPTDRLHPKTPTPAGDNQRYTPAPRSREGSVYSSPRIDYGEIDEFEFGKEAASITGGYEHDGAENVSRSFRSGSNSPRRNTDSQMYSSQQNRPYGPNSPTAKFSPPAQPHEQANSHRTSLQNRDQMLVRNTQRQTTDVRKETAPASDTTDPLSRYYMPENHLTPEEPQKHSPIPHPSPHSRPVSGQTHTGFTVEPPSHKAARPEVSQPISLAANVTKSSPLYNHHNSHFVSTTPRHYQNNVSTLQSTPGAASTLHSSPFRGLSLSPGNIPSEVDEELRSLRSLNDRLLKINEENKKAIDALVYEKEVAILEIKDEYEKSMLDFQRSERARHLEMQGQLTALQEELSLSRQTQTQISSIRATLQREKDLDLLQTRKELLHQKERALEEIRREMANEKNEASRRAAEEISRRSETFVREKGELENRLQESMDRCDALQKDIEKETMNSRAGVQTVRMRLDEAEKELDDHRRLLWDCLSTARTLSQQGEQTRRPVGLRDAAYSVLRESYPPPISLPQDAPYKVKVDALRNHYRSLQETIEYLRSQYIDESLSVDNIRRELEAAHALQLENLRRELRDAFDREMAIQVTRHEKAMQAKCEELDMAVQRERDAVKLDMQRMDSEMRLMAERGEKLRKENHDLQLKLRQQQQQLREEQQHQEHLRGQLAAAQRDVTEPPYSSLPTTPRIQTLADLESFYPELVADLRNALAIENDDRFSTSTARIRDQCTKAYDNAVAKLKVGYAKLEKRITEKLNHEKDAEIARLNAKWQAEMAERDDEIRELRKLTINSKRPNANEGRNSEWEESEKVINLEKMLATMKSDMAALRLQHSLAKEEMEEHHAKVQKLALEKIKAQYLSTLKIMRNDVADSKARAAQRTEEEWKKRKARLDEEWERRFSDLKNHYDAELLRLVPSTPSVGPLYGKIPSPLTKASPTHPSQRPSKPVTSKRETSRKTPITRPDPTSIGSKRVTILSEHLSAVREREPTDVRLLSPSSQISPDSKTLTRADVTRHTYSSLSHTRDGARKSKPPPSRTLPAPVSHAYTHATPSTENATSCHSKSNPKRRTERAVANSSTASSTISHQFRNAAGLGIHAGEIMDRKREAIR